MFFLGVCVLLSLFSPVMSDPVQAKRFTVDLDLPAEERWVDIMHNYVQFVPAIKKATQTVVPPSVLPLVEQLASYLDKYFPEPFPGEMRGIAKALNLSSADVVLQNIFYDLSAYCTSIVVQDKTGNIYHARNLDFEFNGLLRNVTFIVDFKSKGNIVYSGVTFAGMIGLLTAQRSKALTITLDERDRGYIWENFLMAILNKEALPVSFEIRRVVATEGMDFAKGVQILSSVPMIAAAYLIVGGVKEGEGAVITRDRQSAADVWKLDAANNRWFLVETNYDHWTTAPPTDDRRDAAIKALKNIGQANINGTALFKVLSVKLVLNNSTVYTEVMQAKEPGLLNAWIQEP